MEKQSTRITMILITLFWLWFLIGIIGYQPYINKQQPKKEIQKEEPKTEQPITEGEKINEKSNS